MGPQVGPQVKDEKFVLDGMTVLKKSAWALFSLSLSLSLFFAKWGKNELHQTIASGREKNVLKILRLRNTKIMKKVYQKQFIPELLIKIPYVSF